MDRRLLTQRGAMVVVLLATMAAARPARADESLEPPVGGPGPVGNYLRQVHSRFHASWLDSLKRVSPSSGSPSIAAPALVAEVKLTVRWDGTIQGVQLSQTSGSRDFDIAALSTVVTSAPLPPPAPILADDGFAHLRWKFASDVRQCSGGEVDPVEFPLHIAMPNLIARGRLADAVHRMQEELDRNGWAGGDFIAPFARGWLARPTASEDLDTSAAMALALAGDRSQRHRVEAALMNVASAPAASLALDRLGDDVGALLTKRLGDQPSTESRRAAAAAVRALPAAVAHCAPCLEILVSEAADPRRPVGERTATIALLGRQPKTESIERALANAASDPSTAIRGAALLAQITPGQGRGGVIRMAALLHDRSPDIRAAAAAGVLRAGGEQGLEQLYILARERDPRPMIAAASELALLRSEDSAVLLGKLLKRKEKGVRTAAIKALAARKDGEARSRVEPILTAARKDRSEDHEIRLIAMVGAAPEDVARMAFDPGMGLEGYRALLRANLRLDAARWLLMNLESMSEANRITALGDWISESVHYAAKQ